MSSCRAAVWTVIRADKRSVWRDSNESRGFVPLLAHKHYIEHFSNFSYRFRGKLYRDNYRYRIIAQPYLSVRRKCYAPHRIVMPCPGAMTQKNIKPIWNEAFVASSGGIFRCCIASHRVNITLSAFVIGETTNNKHYSTLLITHVQTVSQKRQTVLAELELPHFIETVFVQASIVG